MDIETSWTNATLQSGTSGNISSVIAPSLQLSSENSTYQSLYTEVKLLSFAVHFVPTRAGYTGVTAAHSYVVAGTNGVMNYTTNTTPTNFTNVQNLARIKVVGSGDPRNTVYRMIVPRGLDYLSSATGSDVPSTPTPFAGSPGAVVIFGSNFTNSISYWQVHCVARFRLRARQ
jgi:hypothetical protein